MFLEPCPKRKTMRRKLMTKDSKDPAPFQHVDKHAIGQWSSTSKNFNDLIGCSLS